MKLGQLLIGPLLVAGVLWGACDDEPISHPYNAERYDKDADCLSPGRAVDVVLGAPDDAGFCDAICITDLDGDVYVSGQCPPYPTVYDLNRDVAAGENPLCAMAFAATCRQCPIYSDASIQIICDAGASEDASDAPSDVKDAGPADAAPRDSAKADARRD